MTEGNAAVQGIKKTDRKDVRAGLLTGIVQCNGFRCWAVKGEDLKWRDKNGNVLDVIFVEKTFSTQIRRPEC